MPPKTTILSEPFKKALVHSTRALAEDSELEIIFGSDGPKRDGNKLTLPSAARSGAASGPVYPGYRRSRGFAHCSPQ